MAINVIVCLTLGISLSAIIGAAYGLFTHSNKKAVTLAKSAALAALGASVVFCIAALLFCISKLPFAAVLMCVPAILADVVLYLYIFYRVFYTESGITVCYFLRKYDIDLAEVSDVRLVGKNTLIATEQGNFTLFFMLENISELRELCTASISEREEYDDFADDDDFAEYDDFEDIEKPVKTQKTPAKKSSSKPIMGLIPSLVSAALALCFGFMVISFLLPVYTVDSLSQISVTLASVNVDGDDLIVSVEKYDRMMTIRDYKKTMSDAESFISLPAGQSIVITVPQDGLPLDKYDTNIDIYAVERSDGRIYMNPQATLDLTRSNVHTVRYIAISLTLMVGVACAYLIYLALTQQKNGRR